MDNVQLFPPLFRAGKDADFVASGRTLSMALSSRELSAAVFASGQVSIFAFANQDTLWRLHCMIDEYSLCTGRCAGCIYCQLRANTHRRQKSCTCSRPVFDYLSDMALLVHYGHLSCICRLAEPSSSRGPSCNQVARLIQSVVCCVLTASV